MVASNQFIANVVAAYQAAAAANEATPGRMGCLVELGSDSADEVMITGDLHGQRRNFNRIRKIAALGENPRRHLILQEACHGGQAYPNGGGCMSHAVVEDIARYKNDFPSQVHFLLGNHELAEITDYPIQKNRQMLNVLFRQGMRHMYGDAADEVRQAMLEFLRSCPLAVRLASGIFVCHSVPEQVDTQGFDASIFTRPMDPAEFAEHGAVFDLVWGRDYRSANARAFAELLGASMLVCGHEPCSEGFVVPNPYQLILDCCGEKAGYAILPVAEPMGQDAVVRLVRRLA
jgi:hypothetical protein